VDLAGGSFEVVRNAVKNGDKSHTASPHRIESSFSDNAHKSLHCVRPQKSSEGQAALEQRVQQLEARIVELSTGVRHTSVVPGQ
jgi:hypothetical protein